MVYWHNPQGELQIISVAEAKAIEAVNQKYLVDNYTFVVEAYRDKKMVFFDHTEDENFPIWVYWEQGEENMPEIIKICYQSLLENRNGHPVHLLTKTNFQDFVDIPDFIFEKKAKGLISTAHFSDILRTCLLFQYGGMWIDATVLVTNPIPKMTLELFSIRKQVEYEYVSQFRWTGFLFYCRKENLLFEFVKTFLMEYWQKENRLIDYLLFDYAINMAYIHILEIKRMLDAIPCNNGRVLELKEYCLSFTNFNAQSLKLLTDDTQFHKLTTNLKYNTAELSFYRYLKRKYIGYPNLKQAVVKQENKSLEKQLQEIASRLETQAKQVEMPGLYYGKTGIAIFFFHYAAYTKETKYEDFACELLEEIVPQLSKNYSVDFETGLTGIGVGIEYLVRENFVDADTDDIFAPMDKAFGDLINRNFLSGQNIVDIGKYFLARYHHPGTSEKMLLRQALSQMSVLICRYNKINPKCYPEIAVLLSDINFALGISVSTIKTNVPVLSFPPRILHPSDFPLGLADGYAGLGLSMLSQLDARHASWESLLFPNTYQPKQTMRILVACTKMLNNPYVVSLSEGIASENCSVDLEREYFWEPEAKDYDLIHIHWPEAIFRQWMIPEEEGRNELKEVLRLWKQKGTKIVYTRHDEITHYTRQAEKSRKLFDIIESEADAMIHLGNYSKEQFLKNKKHLEQKHFVIPHHIYDKLYDKQDIEDDRREEARKLLNIPLDRFVILAFGSFRAQEEKDLILNAFEQLDIPNKFLLAPSWNHATRTVLDENFSEENTFLGDWIVEDEMIPDYFAVADVVFLQRLRTLNSGNLPLGFLFNKTVVGPAIGNMNEYLDNVNNFSFQPEQPDSVVKALESAYSRSQSPQINEKYAGKHWRTEKIAELHRKVYEELIKHFF
ncbi:hypothetical protein FACS189426_11350 [Bacteroidia bacterium]|nr:hypothetical protein FACS189426_11350 [Bacteroidia bacterium]